MSCAVSSSGYDAECPNRGLPLRCLQNAPGNATVRQYSSSSSSSSIRDDGRLDYGLPARALDVLYQQYQLSNNIIIDEQNSLKKTSTARNLIIGVFSGMHIIGLLGMNYMAYQRRTIGGVSTLPRRRIAATTATSTTPSLTTMIET